MNMERANLVTPSPMDIHRPPCPVIRPVRKMRFVFDNIRSMMEQEAKHYTPSMDYVSADLSQLDPAKLKDRVTEGWRRKLCEWIYGVVDHFGFDREVASIALGYLDRYSSKLTEISGQTVSKREFQLYAVTCLYIAVKIHGETDVLEGPRLKLKISAFQELSRGFFTSKVIEATERQILTTLMWHLNPPTSAQFVAYYLRLLPEWSLYENQRSYEEAATRIFDTAKYLTELAVCISRFTFESRPSIVAYASVLCAIDSLHALIPYDVRVQFLNNIAEATLVLLPATEPVVRTKAMLMDLFASSPQDVQDYDTSYLAYHRNMETSTKREGIEEVGGKVSPVSVCENNPLAAAREPLPKRSRTCENQADDHPTI